MGVDLVLSSLYPAYLRTPLLRGARIPRLVRFGIYLVIYLLSPARLHDFLFFEDRTSSGYLGLGV